MQKVYVSIFKTLTNYFPVADTSSPTLGISVFLRYSNRYVSHCRAFFPRHFCRALIRNIYRLSRLCNIQCLITKAFQKRQRQHLICISLITNEVVFLLSACTDLSHFLILTYLIMLQKFLITSGYVFCEIYVLQIFCPKL